MSEPADQRSKRSGVTRGEQMLALRKRRMAASHPFLRGGFRPFFFGAASWAVIAVTLWLCELRGKVRLPSGFEATAWHRHEMLFGFVVTYRLQLGQWRRLGSKQRPEITQAGVD